MVQPVKAVPDATEPTVAAIAIGGPRAPPIEKVISRDPGVSDKVNALLETTHIEHVTIDNAAQATVEEQNMGLLQSFKAYPRAVGFSLLFSTAMYVTRAPKADSGIAVLIPSSIGRSVMEGFDLTMVRHPLRRRRTGGEVG